MVACEKKGCALRRNAQPCSFQIYVPFGSGLEFHVEAQANLTDSLKRAW